MSDPKLYPTGAVMYACARCWRVLCKDELVALVIMKDTTDPVSIDGVVIHATWGR